MTLFGLANLIAKRRLLNSTPKVCSEMVTEQKNREKPDGEAESDGFDAEPSKYPPGSSEVRADSVECPLLQRVLKATF